MWNIRYMGFAKGSSSVPTLGTTFDKALQQSLKVEVPKLVIEVIVKLKDLQLKRDQRQRLKSQDGTWFCKKDDRNVYYFALCQSNYPQRHIYAAFAQMIQHLVQLGDYQNQADSVLRLHSKQKMTQIVQKFNDLKNLDKIGEANRLLSDIKDDLTQNTVKLMNNTVNLDNLQQKASNLKQNAMMFESSAGEIERQMWCRNCKMKVIIGLVLVALICVIVIPIVVTKK